MATKLRKRIKEKIGEIQEQREVLVAILDQFVSDAVEEGEKVIAVEDNAQFMRSYVEVMQDLSWCYSTCVLLTADFEERIDNFGKNRLFQNKQNASKDDLSTSLKVTLISEENRVCDQDVSTGKVTDTLAHCKSMDQEQSTTNEKESSIQCDDLQGKTGFSSSHLNIDSKTSNKAAEELPAGADITDIEEVVQTDSALQNKKVQDLLKCKSQACEISEGSNKEDITVIDDKIRMKQVTSYGLQLDDLNVNIDGAGFNKVDSYKDVKVGAVSPKPFQARLDMSENSPKKDVPLDVDDDVSQCRKCPNKEVLVPAYAADPVSFMVEKDGNSVSEDSSVTTFGYSFPKKPSLDMEVAKRFLSGVLRQAKKDNQVQRPVSPDQFANVTPDAESSDSSLKQDLAKETKEISKTKLQYISNINTDDKHYDKFCATKESSVVRPHPGLESSIVKSEACIVTKDSSHLQSEPSLIFEESKIQNSSLLEVSLDSAYQTKEDIQITEESLSRNTATKSLNSDQHSDDPSKHEIEDVRSGGLSHTKISPQEGVISGESCKSTYGSDSVLENASTSSEQSSGPHTCVREQTIVSASLFPDVDGHKQKESQAKQVFETHVEIHFDTTVDQSLPSKGNVTVEKISVNSSHALTETQTSMSEPSMQPALVNTISASSPVPYDQASGYYGVGPRLSYMNFMPRRILSVVVSEVCNPWLFYVQEWSNHLQQMMEKLSKYMLALLSTTEEGVTHGKISEPVLGMTCLARYSKDGCFYRAKVTKIYTSGTDPTVNVTYVDYGNKERRKLTDLWELPAQFTVLPVQAHSCCLAKVAPSNKYGVWTEQDISYFSRVTMGQQFNLFPVHPSTDQEVPSFVDLFYNVPQMVMYNGKQVLVPGPNQVSVHALLLSKNGSKLIDLQEQIQLVLQTLGETSRQQIKSTNSSNVITKTETETTKETPNIQNLIGTKNFQSGSSGKLSDSQTKLKEHTMKEKSEDCVKTETNYTDSLPKMPRPLGKSAQEKCMSKCDRKNYSRNGREQKTSSPSEVKGTKSQNILSPSKGKNIKGQSSDSKEKSLNNLNPSSKIESGYKNIKNLDEAESARVSKTVLNITEMKVQNHISPEDKESVSSSETGSVHYPGDEDFKAPNDYQVPSNSMDVMVSHMNSPSDFYIHPVSKVWGETLSLLMLGLKKQVEHLSGKKLKKLSKNFSPEVGQLCCAQFTQDNQFYRALVTYIELSSPTKKTKEQKEDDPGESNSVGKVHVFYIDFGDKEILPKRKVFPLPIEYMDIPGLAIHCSLAYVQPVSFSNGKQPAPPGEEKWCKKALDKFVEFVGFEKIIKMMIMLGDITYTVEKHPRDVVKFPPLKVMLVDYVSKGDNAVKKDSTNQTEPSKQGDFDKTKESDVEEVCLNMELIKLGMASLVQNLKEEDEGQSSLTPEKLKSWDPMREAYLEERNSYKIDTDDAGVATTGYKQKMENICPYFQKGDCWRGELCSYRHVIEAPGAVTMDQELVFGDFEEFTKDEITPNPGTWVACEVATILNPSHFYILLPWGKKPLEMLEKDQAKTQNTDDFHEETLEDLMNSMNEFYKGSTYGGSQTHYAPGEMLVAPFAGDGQWYRARVVDTSENGLEVFYVDFGNKEWVKEREVRTLEPQFTHLPFQAMECFLVDIQPLAGQHTYSAEAKQAFRELVDGKTLVAFIRARSLSGCLHVELYDTTGEEDVSIGLSLVQLSLVEESKDPTISSCTSEPFTTSSRSNSQDSLILIPG